MAKQNLPQERQWYVIHTYSGYEDAVSKSLKQRIESLGMEDRIFNVLVPKEKKIKIKGGKRKVTEEKIYPGYVLVEMIVTDESWYVVRNTPNVTGFVGAGTTPVPIHPDELETLKRRMDVEEPKYEMEFQPGESVKVADGPFKDYDGKVVEVDKKRGKIKGLINIFGRDTPVELDSLQVKKL